MSAGLSAKRESSLHFEASLAESRDLKSQQPVRFNDPWNQGCPDVVYRQDKRQCLYFREARKTMNTVMQKSTVSILIGGEAGQGLVTVGELLAKSLVRAGYHIVVTQDYMSRIRGGHNTFAIRASTNPITASQDTIDLLVALNEESFSLHANAITATGLIIADEAAGDHPGMSFLKIPFSKLAPKNLVNVAALGVAGCLLGLEESNLGKVVDELFDAKKVELVEGNRRALVQAYTWASAQMTSFPRLAPPISLERRLMMNGNDGIAMGALAGGVKFCSFYPMTPSTSIPLTLIKHAAAMGVVVEQAEDEIAAINMAIGASFAGAPSMVATSGGGFALMVEGVSLAGMTETPLVIVVGQRPGPATGLPTRTEQGDLEFVLHSGHGEFPRAILTPGSVEECFDLARKAFVLAECHQSPVFVLTDQFLADSHRDIMPFDMYNTCNPSPCLRPDPAATYKRYTFTESGVSPRLLPGRDRQLVVADSDEHTEDGHITEDLSVRKRMVEKRLDKLGGLKADVISPEYGGDRNPEFLLVSWGSTRGAVMEAREALREDHIRAGSLHFSQVWPLVPELFTPYFDAAREIVMIEGNATGQFAGLIKRETGISITRRISRYDGLPITPRFILEALKNQKLSKD